jgi:Arc/MetJ-type ribon-helix-helix transcriptional regulator
MSGHRLFLSAAIILVCSLQSFGQGPEDSEELFSPHNARTFYEAARELYLYADLHSPEAKQAEVFFNAALALDKRADYALPDLIMFATRYLERDYSELVLSALERYVDKDSNLEVIRVAVRYLLERRGSLEQRIGLLRNLAKTLGEKNGAFNSDLATELALMATERASYSAASSLLWEAYLANPYNELAFAKFNELSDTKLEPAVYLRHLRLALRAEPLDIETALRFADYVESLGLYKLAIDAYGYCAELFSYLRPSEPLPAVIYLPWVRSCYNVDGKQNKCLQIAEDVRKAGTFDLFLETIAARAALKTGGTAEADKIFQSLNSRAQKQLALRREDSPRVPPEQWAWFYCFAHPDADKALAWANMAYAEEPNSTMVTAILAYSLAMNGHFQLAEPFVKDSHKFNQIAALTMGLIQLAGQQKETALETLKAAVAMDTGSLEAHQAKRLLEENGSGYIPLYDAAIISGLLEEEFGKAIVPTFAPAGKILSVKLGTLGGSEFGYGANLSANFVIANDWSEPFVIGDNGLAEGHIRVDAEIGGEVNAKIPNLANFRFIPSKPVEPREFVVIPLQLDTGKFREVLRNYPQASIEIKLKGYLDPATDANGTLANCFPDVKPAELVIRRRPVDLNSRYLQSRLESLTRGQQGQKIISVKLFAGLLLEQDIMQKSQLPYKVVSAEPVLLNSALTHALADEDWTVKLQTVAALIDVPLDYELTRALAGNLNDENWPVRVMTLFVLARSQGVSFEKVLDWTAAHDTNEYVRDMAVALGGTASEVKPQQVF